MESTIGWLELSPEALRRMRHELEEDGDGVLDEIGVLALHTGYADHFFPGTSVLHTHPRYLFFTCWNYLTLAADPKISQIEFAQKKQEAEYWVTERLLRTPGLKGIIGGRKFPDPPAQPADFAYWTALNTYRFYEGADRGDLARKWNGKRIVHLQPKESLRSEEHVEDEHLARIWCPPPPKKWLANNAKGSLSFELSKDEALFLRERLITLDNCLLAEAVRLLDINPLPTMNHCWTHPLIKRAAASLGESDRLIRAKQSSAMAEILRAIYASLVERIIIEVRGKNVKAMHRPYRELLSSYWTDGADKIIHEAIALDPHSVSVDVGGLHDDFMRLLQHVKASLQKIRTGADAARLLTDEHTYELFTAVEVRRKGARARLPRTPAAYERRRDFGPESVRVYGLDYRWTQVFTMLSDLHRGLNRG